MRFKGTGIQRNSNMRPITNGRLAVLFTTLFLVGIPAAHTATLNWPGFAPCDASLQACINAAADGDTVRIGGLSPQLVNETIFIQAKSLVLESSAWNSATFTAGNSITINANGSGNHAVTIRNITLRDGHVGAVHDTSGNATIAIEGVRILRRSDGGYPITVEHGNSPGLGDLQLTVRDCELHTYNADPGGLQGGIRIYATTNINQLTTIANNNIFHSGSAAHNPAINLISQFLTSHSATIDGNRIWGENFSHGLLVNALGTGGLELDVVNNSVTGQRDFLGWLVLGEPAALSLFTSTSINARIFNNTLAYGESGLLLGGGSGTINAEIKNNVIAHNSGAGYTVEPGTVADANYNLFFDNASANSSGGANDLLADPGFSTYADLRLPAGSPAVDSGIAPPFLMPNGDRDGSARLKGGAIDRGALEWGNLTFRHTADMANTFQNYTLLDPALGGGQGNLLQATSAQNRDGANWVPWMDYYPGLWWTGLTWSVFRESPSSLRGVGNNMNPADHFHLFRSLAPRTHIVHIADAGSVSGSFSTIDHAELNGDPDKIIIVTPGWDSNHVYNDHPVGLYYDSGAARWSLFNQDGAAMPVGKSFNILALDPGPNAFRLTATVDNVYEYFGALRHRLLDHNPCAAPQVSRFAPTLADINPHPFALSYSQEPLNGTWSILNQDSYIIPAGSVFNVFVDGSHAAHCKTPTLYLDGFE